MADYDLAIIGGGLNGVSIARDAAGRGLRVILLEQEDLGSAASSASPRLIHGDLAVLERRGFFRVRNALAERDIWLRTAPHLVRPVRFVIPAHADERPPWLLRTALLIYDRLATRNDLPASATVDLSHHPIGVALKRPFGEAFEYSDCVVDDSRLGARPGMTVSGWIRGPEALLHGGLRPRDHRRWAERRLDRPLSYPASRAFLRPDGHSTCRALP
jgi:glycerol-3-phosphate dehydrogenase